MIGGLGRARQYDAAMDEVTDDSISRRPVVAMARAVIRAEIGGIEQGLQRLMTVSRVACSIPSSPLSSAATEFSLGRACDRAGVALADPC